jgi:superoxide dismutase, Fe-Mn family
VGHLAGTDILLIMDVFEHSYLTDYGVKRADYIDKFIFLIDWETVEKRFNR